MADVGVVASASAGIEWRVAMHCRGRACPVPQLWLPKAGDHKGRPRVAPKGRSYGWPMEQS